MRIEDGPRPAHAREDASASDAPARSGAMPMLDGYVADALYPSTFHAPFAPASLNAILAWHRLRPPRAPREPFSLVDLGCGDGAGLVLLAAAHPEGRFLGVDGLEGHVARGRALAVEIGLDNVAFECRTFAAAGDLAEGEADYVVAQGVLAWISPANRAALLDLAARLLRPGGLFCVGYNTLPGWGPIAGFQRLVRALAEGKAGSSRDRFQAALEQIRTGGMVAPSVLDWLQPDKLPPDYFAQEYLNVHWQPLWSGDVIAAAGERGLAFAGQAYPARLRPDFTLRKAWREAIAGIEDIAAREIAADLFVNSFFRADLYAKGALEPLPPEQAQAMRLDQVWASPRGKDDLKLEARTAAGRISFDNAAARAILAHLEDGPAPLKSVPGIASADLLNTIDALQLARLAVPLSPTADTPCAAAANRALAGALAGTSMNARVGANGVATVPEGIDPDAPEVVRRLAIVRDDGQAGASGAKRSGK
jgi:SAM-dependent methyltransferase